MFSLLHEYLITDLNTEKKTKSTVKKYKLYFGISVSLRTCIHVLSLNYVNFMLLQYVVNSQSSSSFPLAFPVIWGRRYGC